MVTSAGLLVLSACVDVSTGASATDPSSGAAATATGGSSTTDGTDTSPATGGEACIPYENGEDGLYPGYRACSTAHFPSFLVPTRWDGHYEQGCPDLRGDDLYACAQQTLWQALQYDIDRRPAAFDELIDITARAEQDPDIETVQLGHLNWAVAQLGIAMVSEQGDLEPGPALTPHLYRAFELEPDNTVLEAWVLTFEVNAAVFFMGDVEAALDAVWALYEEAPEAVTGGVIATATAMPLSSGWPYVAVEALEAVDPDYCGDWCGWEFLRAPYVLSGQDLINAEVYARVGDQAKAQQWLEQSLARDNSDSWPFRPDVEAALADLDGFVGKFAAAGADARVDGLMITNTKGTCMACHAPAGGAS